MSNTRTTQNKFLIVVAGPTAVGKTAISIQLAKIFDAEIFSADSRQIYKEMSVGTAKPTEEEMSGVKHHFINHISIHQKYSAGQYEQEINSMLDQYFLHHDIAILSGGTGLYIKVLLEGLDELPDVSDAVVSKYNGIYDKEGLPPLLLALAEKDPIYYQKVDKGNHRRIIRALSVIESSGRSYSSYLSGNRKRELPFKVIPILLELPRDILYDRINTRVAQMLNSGLMEEVELLYPFKGVQALETVGYQEMFDWKEGRQNYELAVSLIKQNSRRYAKRQITWFKKHGNWVAFSPTDLDGIHAFVHQEVGLGEI